MQAKKEAFLACIGGKKTPNDHEKMLFLRAEKYIEKIKNIRGLKMIAICNSLSMFATKAESDIDLFIVTEKNMLWYVRFWVTVYFWKMGVWRKGEDVAGNFCLSFFATENALDMEKIAITDDVYLYFWTYFLKPVLDYDNTYEKFLEKNTWVTVDAVAKYDNKKYRKFAGKSRKIRFWHCICNNIIRFFLKWKTQKNFEKMGRPSGVIISDDMLKFHDRDQRENFRESFLAGKKFQKNF